MVMTEREILSLFAGIVEEYTGIPASRVTLEADVIDELDISSLSMVEIIVSAQDRFNVEIPDEALKDFRTVQDIVGFVRRGQRPDVNSGVPGDSAPEVAAT
jgi:acyl carrier protein